MSEASDQLNAQQDFINDLISQADAPINNAQNITAYAADRISVEAVSPPTPYDPGAVPEPPEFQEISIPEAGDMPELSGELGGLSELFTGELPSFSNTAPTLDFGTVPSQLAEFVDQGPTINTDFDFPPVPSQFSQVFNAPTVGNYAVPTAPTVQTPSFDAVMPTDTPQAPTDLAATFTANFADMRTTLYAVAESQMDEFLIKINPRYHTQMAAIETQLDTYLNGGTGLKPEVEDAIYSRARGKNDAEARRARDQALNDAATRGFTLPTGALMSAVQQARQAGADNNSRAASEIVVMQAEMEQKNLQFAVTTSAEMRKAAVSSMVSFFQSATALTGMAIDCAKNILNALIQAYDTQVKVYSVKLEGYKAAASVYDTKARVAAQIIEIYKAEIQALAALTNVDRAKIDIYTAQIGTLRAYADVYKTQVDATVSKASLEKLRLDLFQSQVQAYSTKVQAKSAEWQGYQARLSAEESKVKVFSAQVQAFNGQIEAFKAQHAATAEKIKAEATRNSALLQELTARVSAYEANIRAQTAVASGNIETLRQHYAAYKGKIDVAVAQEQMKLEAYRANVSATLQTAKQNVDSQVANASSSAHTLAALAQIHGKILDVYSGPASAAAAGMVALASVHKEE